MKKKHLQILATTLFLTGALFMGCTKTDSPCGGGTVDPSTCAATTPSAHIHPGGGGISPGGGSYTPPPDLHPIKSFSYVSPTKNNNYFFDSTSTSNIKNTILPTPGLGGTPTQYAEDPAEVNNPSENLAYYNLAVDPTSGEIYSVPGFNSTEDFINKIFTIDASNSDNTSPATAQVNITYTKSKLLTISIDNTKLGFPTNTTQNGLFKAQITFINNNPDRSISIQSITGTEIGGNTNNFSTSPFSACINKTLAANGGTCQISVTFTAVYYKSPMPLSYQYTVNTSYADSLFPSSPINNSNTITGYNRTFQCPYPSELTEANLAELRNNWQNVDGSVLSSIPPVPTGFSTYKFASVVWLDDSSKNPSDLPFHMQCFYNTDGDPNDWQNRIYISSKYSDFAMPDNKWNPVGGYGFVCTPPNSSYDPSACPFLLN